MFKKIMFVTFVMLFLSTTVSAMEIGGISLPDTMSLETEKGELILNGAGIRKKFGFKIYVGALYIKSKSSNSQQIINADEPVAVTMTYRRKAPADKLTNGFKESMTIAAGSKLTQMQTDIDKFLSVFAAPEKDDVWKFIYIPGEGTTTYFNDQPAAPAIKGLDFRKILFGGAWLLETDDFKGDTNLRDGMLGK